MSPLTNLQELILSYNDIDNIEPIGKMKNLRKLELVETPVLDFNVISGLDQLQILSLGQGGFLLSGGMKLPFNDLSPLTSLTNLRELSVRGTSLNDLTILRQLTNLTDLSLPNNQIQDIHALQGLTGLTKLFLHGNEISDISVLHELPELTSISLGDNPISDLSALLGLTKLETLSIRASEISDLSPLRESIELRNIDLASNQVSDISVMANFHELVQLNLNNNAVSNISSLAGLEKLWIVHLDKNQISDVSSLRGLSKLSTLSLASNQISDISSLGTLEKLTELNLSGNNISDVSALKQLTKLRTLKLDRNKIKASDIEALIEALPDCKISADDQQVDNSVKEDMPPTSTADKWERVFNPVMESLRMSNFNGYIDEMYGEIINYTDRNWTYVEIMIELYDADDKYVGNANAVIAETIKSGNTAKFRTESMYHLYAKKYKLIRVSPMGL